MENFRKFPLCFFKRNIIDFHVSFTKLAKLPSCFYFSLFDAFVMAYNSWIFQFYWPLNAAAWLCLSSSPFYHPQHCDAHTHYRFSLESYFEALAYLNNKKTISFLCVYCFVCYHLNELCNGGTDEKNIIIEQFIISSLLYCRIFFCLPFTKQQPKNI